MLRFVLRKMRAKKWMMLCLLIGNVLLVAISCVNPMYTRAVLQKTLLSDMKAILTEKNVYPGGVTITASLLKQKGVIISQENYREARQAAQALSGQMGVPLRERVEELVIPNVQMTSRSLREDDREGKRINVGCLSDMAAHSALLAGTGMGNGVQDGVIDVVVSEKALLNLNLLVGEVLDTVELTTPDGQPLAVRIAGVYEASQTDDPYWVTSPAGYNTTVMMDEQLFCELFVQEGDERYPLRATWNLLLDYTQMDSDRAQHYLDVLGDLRAQFPTSRNVTVTNNFGVALESFLSEGLRVRVTLLVLQAPIFALLAVFIFMVSRQMAEMEEAEIAVLKSRGAGRAQILGVYLIQSALLAALGLIAGVPLSLLLCQVLGSANAFLEFVSRTALPARVDGSVLLCGALAALLSVGTMLLPVVKFSRVSIVSQKRAKRAGRGMPWWQKSGLDVLLLAVSLYGWYTFNAQKDALAQRVLDGQSLDPLMVLSASLFIIGAGLLMVRLLPLAVHLVYLIGRRWWSPALFSSFLQVIRTRGSQGFIMVFLIFTVALGMFNATAARTIGDNAERNTRYTIGADIVLKEAWADSGQSSASGPESAGDTAPTRYVEPEFDGYRTLDGVASATRVLNDSSITVALSGGASLKGVRLMGIHTREFGQTAWFDESLLPVHWYEYLNVLSQDPEAVLLSENFERDYGYRLGDAVTFRSSDGATMRGVVYGFVPYWPTYGQVVSVRGSDGVWREQDSYLIVANLTQVQSAFGVTPYEVWIQTDGGSTQFIYDYIESSGKKLRSFRDANAEIIEQKRDAVMQGTNGILTVGFIVALVLCTVGFLIYWILSIRQRALQMGIFRAMGMTLREILTMLINEQVWISGLSIAAGAGIGWAASQLYVPLIQIAYAASDQLVPLRIVMSAADNLRLFAVVGLVMAVCLCVLGGIVRRMQIAKALKLGED
ncbi:MAG: FtsX-like permease family protein [Candidatus Spyradocola sp.]|nr:FtsX-like permease family protein [Candidatus Spyradocola sp.]